jgi:hypothetical protein
VGTRTAFPVLPPTTNPNWGGCHRGSLAEFQSHDWEAIYGPDPRFPIRRPLSTFENSKLDW